MGPVSRAVWGGVSRRRVQMAVIGLVLLVSTGACVPGLALVMVSSSPFDHAFAAQRGAHVTAVIDPSRVTPAELAATARLPQVSAAVGPFAETTISAELTPAPLNSPGGQSLGPLTLAGRSSPGGPVDDVTLQSGHWARQPGQVVLSGTGLAPGVADGTRLIVTGLPGQPVLTVVGIATSVTGSASGWVVPGQIAALRAPGAPASEQMLYRFRDAGTDAVVSADIAAVAAALPAGAVTATQSYLSARAQATSNAASFAPFLVAFGVLGLVMSVLIVANVVSGAVVTGYRRIGILKSIGFTPGQVSAAYVSQAMIPAVAGCIAGAVLGHLLGAALLAKTASAYRVGTLGAPLWTDAAVPLAMCGLTGIAALLPAVRAGRLSAVQAIADGRAPGVGRGYTAHRLLARLWLPRPVTIGLAAPFARPARSAVTLAAVLFGATAVIFAVGLGSSLRHVVSGLSLTSTEQVQIQVGSGGGVVVVNGRAKASEPVPKALAAQPGTLHYVGESDEQASAAGLSQPVSVTAFTGDAAWTGYPLLRGHWYTAPGQADVPTDFLSETGTTIGDTVTIVFGGKQIPVRVAGEIFGTGLVMITDSRTLASAGHPLSPSQYDVQLRPGTSTAAYVRALSTTLGPADQVSANTSTRGLPIVLGLISILTLLLAIVAGLGVLNTVVLQTRERTHDLGVFKAVGMTPRQAITMVICSVAVTGLAAGAIAIPAGVALHQYVLPRMAAAAGTGLPASFLNVYSAPELTILALAGVIIAVAGALLPAGWAAKTSTASALRAQ
jgi:putative ABC transport system permease protein